MKNIVSLISGVVFGIIVSLIIMRIDPYIKEYKSLKSIKSHNDTTNLVMQGGTRMYGPNGFHNDWTNYDLRSWDGGKNWYVVDYNFDTKEFKIIGESEKIYPGLIEHLQNWNKVTDYVSKNGHIDIINDTVGTKILEDAGFEIKK